MNRYNAEHGTELVPEMVTTWDAMVSLTHFRSNSEFWEWAENGDGPGLFRFLQLITGATAALDRLSHDHEIVIITTKPPWAISETFAWIADNDIPTREVHITRNKWRIDCDFYLDDGPHNRERLVTKRPNRTVCRFIRPWNRPVEDVVDIDSWETFERLVRQRSS